MNWSWPIASNILLLHSLTETEDNRKKISDRIFCIVQQLSSSSVICCRLAITCEADSCQPTVYTLFPLCSWETFWTVRITFLAPISTSCYDPSLSLLCELQRTGWSWFEHGLLPQINIFKRWSNFVLRTPNHLFASGFTDMRFQNSETNGIRKILIAPTVSQRCHIKLWRN